MKTSIKLLIFCIILAAVYLLPSVPTAQAAGCTGTGNCYWVGGTGNFSDTTKWATTSGGGTTGGLPGTGDNCIFDSASDAAGYTATVDAASNCLDLTIGAPATGTFTFAGSADVNVYGSETIAASGISHTYSGAYYFKATSTGKTVDSPYDKGANAGNVNNYTFDGVGGGWTLGGAMHFLSGGTHTVTLTNGALILGSYWNTSSSGNVTFNSNNSNTRSLTLAATTYSVSGWNITDSTNMTLDPSTSTISTTSFWGGGLTYYGFDFTANLSNNTIYDANTWTSFSRTSGSNYRSITFGGNQTVTGTLTLSGASSTTQRLFVVSDVIGTTRTFTVTGATVVFTDADFRDITVTGATPTSTRVGDAGGNSGIGARTPATMYWIHTATASLTMLSTNWSTSSGGASGDVCLLQDICKFDLNSFPATGKTVVESSTYRYGSILWSGVTNSPTFSLNGAVDLYGSMTLEGTGSMTLAGTSLQTFVGRGASTLTTAGQTFANAIDVDALGGTLTLQDAYTSTNYMTLTNGTLNTNGYTVTISVFNSNNANARTLTMGASTVILTSTGTVWNFVDTTNLTTNPGTSVIQATNNSTSSKTFALGGATWYDIYINTLGTGVSIMTGDGSTLHELKIDPSRTVQFTGAKTTYFSSGINSLGGAGTEATITRVSGTTYTLSKTGGGTACMNYVILSYATGDPASTWYADNSTNGGNNTNVTFSACPATATPAPIPHENIRGGTTIRGGTNFR